MESRANEIRKSDPEDPDRLARRAGIDLYGTSVGILRRSELWRLGNAWGMNFPVGCSKDYMLPFFKQLEADGKNPLQPPGQNLDKLVKVRDVTHSTEVHSVTATEDGILPKPKSEFERNLEALPHGQLKKFCKERGIPQSNKDRHADLVARIIAKVEGKDEPHATQRSQ